MQGTIHRTSIYIFSLIFCLRGVLAVTKALNKWIISKISGRPITPTILLLNIFASLQSPKCIAMVFGSLFHNIIPANIGNRVIILVKINVFLFLFTIRITSLKYCNFSTFILLLTFINCNISFRFILLRHLFKVCY